MLSDAGERYNKCPYGSERARTLHVPAQRFQPGHATNEVFKSFPSSFYISVPLLRTGTNGKFDLYLIVADTKYLL